MVREHQMYKARIVPVAAGPVLLSEARAPALSQRRRCHADYSVLPQQDEITWERDERTIC